MSYKGYDFVERKDQSTGFPTGQFDVYLGSTQVGGPLTNEEAKKLVDNILDDIAHSTEEESEDDFAPR